MILPGHTATWGDREGGRKLFSRTLSELCSGSSEGTEGFLAPLPVSLLVQFFSSKREKVQKPVDDGIKSFLLYENSRCSNIIILRLTKPTVFRFDLFVALSFLEKKGQRRKEKQARGKEGSTANRLNKRELRKTNPKDGFLFRSVRSLAHHLLPPSRSPILARVSSKRSIIPGHGRLVQPRAFVVSLCSCASFAVLCKVYTVR